MWVLTRGKRLREINLNCVAVATTLLLLSTAHLSIDTARLIEGLVKDGNEDEAHQALFFVTITQWGFFGKNALYVLQTMLADMIVMYRCYAVWQSRWVIAVPAYLWLSVGVSGFGSVYEMAHEKQDPTNIFASYSASWVLGFFIETLVANALSTGLLAYRIWMVARASARYSLTEGRHSILAPLPRIIVDSGLLYSATLCAMLACFVAQNWAYYILLDMVSPIISITFYMVLVRVEFSRQRSSGDSALDPDGTNNALEFHKDTVVSSDRPPYPMRTRVRAADIKSDLSLGLSYATLSRSRVSFGVLPPSTPRTPSRLSVRRGGWATNASKERPKSHPSILSTGDVNNVEGGARSPSQRHVHLTFPVEGRSRSRVHLDIPISPESFAISFPHPLARSPSPGPSQCPSPGPSMTRTPPASPTRELPYTSRLSLPESPTWWSRPESMLDSPDSQQYLVDKGQSAQ